MRNSTDYPASLEQVSLQPLELYNLESDIVEQSRLRRDNYLKWLHQSDHVDSETTEHVLVSRNQSIGLVALTKGIEYGSQPWIFISDIYLRSQFRNQNYTASVVAATYRHLQKPDWSVFVPCIYSDEQSEGILSRLTNTGLISNKYNWEAIKQSQLRRREPRRTKPRELLNLFEVGLMLEPLREILKVGKI